MRWVIIAVLGLAVLGLGGSVAVMATDLSRMRAADAAGAEAVAAARAVTPDLLSYNYRTIEQDLARAGEHTTGELSKHYAELARTLVGQARADKKVQQAAVAGAAVERATPDRVDVLVFVNMGVAVGSEQQFSQNRARLTMVRTDSRWLVAELSTLVGKA
ncbi:hypothetical protein [Nonomuraea soli]|uniref:Mce-associated membrane protein n=1 Tax=Nonomuraea soli TaxID=1032476 RepID=A0A7W0HVD3_9ACTN|nr:hypothetical protein [Nonomuraea soli]MBA2897144.1 Mce-associated membrane protein [Nonomuraea soli]